MVQICSDIRWFSGSFPLLSISKPISKHSKLIPKPILLLIITVLARRLVMITSWILVRDVQLHRMSLHLRQTGFGPGRQRWPKLFQTSLPSRSDLLETRPRTESTWRGTPVYIGARDTAWGIKYGKPRRSSKGWYLVFRASHVLAYQPKSH